MVVSLLVRDSLRGKLLILFVKPEYKICENFPDGHSSSSGLHTVSTPSMGIFIVQKKYY